MSDTFTVTEADFQDGFTIVDITGQSKTQNENRYNCATPAAAARLLAHLNTLGLHPVPTTDFPQPGWSGAGQFKQEGPGDGKVPYLDFTITDPNTGIVQPVDHENAGGILVEYLRVGQRLTDWNCTENWYKGAA